MNSKTSKDLSFYFDFFFELHFGILHCVLLNTKGIIIIQVGSIKAIFQVFYISEWQ